MDRLSPNVIVTETEREGIIRQERHWNGTRLVVLCTVTLAICLAILYYLAGQSVPDPHPHPYLPWMSP